ncbi:MAG: DMT family transporter [Rhodoferax sp.]|nr:DMT family transporter [Rhodoferax sp.]MBP7492261.1 DMT family transporter [Rhodoferax sp.]
MKASVYALCAIALWASLAALALSLRHVPAFFLTGVCLMMGSVLAWPAVLRRPSLWRMPLGTLVFGVLSLFGYHFLLFMGLRLAPAVEVNLINYLWPLFLVVLAPLYLPAMQLRPVHLIAAAMGFGGAIMAIWGARTGSTPVANTASPVLGYLLALGAAWAWANYSLQTKRLTLQGRGFPTAAIGLFGLVSGGLSLLCHWALEPAVSLSLNDWGLLALLGLGPLGASFFLWDKALKLGDARHIGILSYITPLASTTLLLVASARPLTLSIAGAAALIMGAAVLGTRSRSSGTEGWEPRS